MSNDQQFQVRGDTFSGTAQSSFTVKLDFPASRGLFSVVFTELTGTRKSDLCPGLKRTVFSMCHSYLATAPSREANDVTMQAQ